MKEGYEDVVKYYARVRRGYVLRVEETDCDGVRTITLYRPPRLYQQFQAFLDYLHDHAEGPVFVSYHKAGFEDLGQVDEIPEFMTRGDQ